MILSSIKGCKRGCFWSDVWSTMLGDVLLSPDVAMASVRAKARTHEIEIERQLQELLTTGVRSTCGRE